MNNPPPTESEAAPVDHRDVLSAMFTSLVIQQTNMASIFLGLAPHPQTGEVAQDLEHAKYFIDQLEMLEVKTKGNLDKMEDGLLKQSLTGLRLAFVEAVSKPAPRVISKEEAEPPAAAQPAESSAPSTPAPEAAAPTADPRKKFTKKY